jgi:hypothetical protein
MSQATKESRSAAAEQNSLRRRVKRMYDSINRENWGNCFALIDPKLREQAKVRLPEYSERMRAFKAAYREIKPWHVRLSLHLDATGNKHDPRPFAYVYVVWQDASHGFHMFRERWVRDSDGWFSRVVGLVPNPTESSLAAG